MDEKTAPARCRFLYKKEMPLFNSNQRQVSDCTMWRPAARLQFTLRYLAASRLHRRLISATPAHWKNI